MTDGTMNPKDIRIHEGRVPSFMAAIPEAVFSDHSNDSEIDL
jgi:hypothetical protein